MEYVWAIALVLVNIAWLGLNLLGLPGNWLMIGATAGVAWLQADKHLFSGWTLLGIVFVAVVAEVLEFIAGAAGAAKAGASRKGAAGALVGGFIGAIAGTALVPIPVIGSLLGACMGAFAGTMLMEFAIGRSHAKAAKAGMGAGIGRFVGTTVKVLAGIVIWLIVAVAAFWP